MQKRQNRFMLKKFCLDLGIDVFGVADISNLKQGFFLGEKAIKGLDNAVSLGGRLSACVLNDIADAPTKLYFHHYRTLNAFLDQAALRVCNYLQKKGYQALPIPASQIVDWQKQTAHLSHKKLGVLAGVGWIGRNNLLVNRRLGSQLRLVTILTDMPLKTDKPTEDNCGSCRMCIKVCPAGAITDNPAEFDHRKCFEKLKEFQKQRLVEQYICGICVRVCGGRVF
jgi:epoxyqueuosine reductase QueG